MNIDKTKQNGTLTQDIELPVDPISENCHDYLQGQPEMLASDYRTFKKDFIEWVLIEGKEPATRTGYAETTLAASGEVTANATTSFFSVLGARN